MPTETKHGPRSGETTLANLPPASARPELAVELELLERMRAEREATQKQISEIEDRPRPPMPDSIARAKSLIAGEEPARPAGEVLGTLHTKVRLLDQAIADQEGKASRVRLAVSASAGREVHAEHMEVVCPIARILDDLDRVLDEEQAYRSVFRRAGYDSRGLGLSEFKELLAGVLPELRRLRQVLRNMGVEP